MAAVNPAQFTINGNSFDSNGNKIYRAVAGEALILAAAFVPNPAIALTYSIYDPNDSSSPPASATEILNRGLGRAFTFDGAGQFSRTLAPSATTTLTMYDGVSTPIDGPLSFVIRCTATMADAAGPPPVYERGVSLIAFPDNWREPCFGERDQFFDLGWGYAPLGLNMRNSFPQQSKYSSGTISSVTHVDVDILPAGKSRTLLLIGEVYAKQNSGAEGLWGMRRKAATDGSGNLTISTLAGGETLDGTISETDFQPSFEVHTIGGVQYAALRIDQKTGSKSFNWEAWFTVMEAAR